MSLKICVTKIKIAYVTFRVMSAKKETQNTNTHLSDVSFITGKMNVSVK